MSEFSHLSALIVGMGSIGNRHMKNLRELGIEKIAVVDPDPERLKKAVDRPSVLPYADMATALQVVPNVVLICTPPSLHVEQAIAAVRNGAQVFVEKPLSNRMDDVDELAREAERAKAIVQVGFNLRHIPAIEMLRELAKSKELGRALYARFEFGQYLPDWRPWQDYRNSYTARKSLGGGIVLDGCHEIDLAMRLLGKPLEVCCMAGKVSDLEMDVEDSATILLRMESGAQADIHLDCVQRDYTRSLKIIFENGKAFWSWPENVLRIQEVNKKERVVAPQRGYMANFMYVEEMRVFLNSVVNGKGSNSLSEGREVTRVALAALESSAEKRWLSL